MSSEHNTYSAFISHASKDYEKALELVELLEKKGLDCWIAQRNISPSKSYSHEISRGISDSKCVVLLLTDDANHSDGVRNEIELAFRNKKPIFPVRIEDVPPGAELEFFVSSVQWIDAWKGRLTDYIEGIADSIEHGRISPLVGKTPKRVKLKNTLYLIASAVVLGVLILIINELLSIKKNISVVSPQSPGSVSSTLSMEDFEEDDFRPVFSHYNEGDISISIRFSPRLIDNAHFTNPNSDATTLYYSFNGKDYKRGIGASYMKIKLNQQNLSLMKNNDLYIKFEFWDGKNIGPYRYELNYLKYIASKGAES
ncbi:MAG: toll/interleukin-1 receptor domain-containing protein [Gammaproteobacteria bacterium]|nr:toll/interleukin-1 receptor domain-containing protein [Gammaproteobacteria bacterium]